MLSSLNLNVLSVRRVWTDAEEVQYVDSDYSQ